jgi:hypothetical protein
VLLGIYFHTYFFQQYEKQTLINEQNEFQTIVSLLKVIVLTDTIIVLYKYLSTVKLNTILKLIFILCIPTLYLYKTFRYLGEIQVDGYIKTYIICRIVYCLSNYIKIISIFNKRKIIADLLKFLDTLLLVNIVLIGLTDPIVNTSENPGAITFYDVYFRYLEFHVLILGMIFLLNDKNIDAEVQGNCFSLSSVIGKYDSFRFCVIFLLSHYYFIFVNGLAYSFK